MKITAKEIRLITDAIVDQIYDQEKVNEKINNATEKAWNEFSKSKLRKDTVKILKLWRQLDWFEWITVKDFEFFKIKSFWSMSYKITSEDKVKESYKGWIHSKVAKEFPDRYVITRKVETLLTIKTLCWKDMEAIMNEIITTVKKEFKL